MLKPGFVVKYGLVNCDASHRQQPIFVTGASQTVTVLVEKDESSVGKARATGGRRGLVKHEIGASTEIEGALLTR